MEGLEDHIISLLTDFRNRQNFEEQKSPASNPQDFDKECLIEEHEVTELINKSTEIVLGQPMLLELIPPLNICGDVHGQFLDLLWIFECGQFPPQANYLFLGDYVDRGRYSIEVMCLLMAFKIKYPTRFFILRGNHECNAVNESYGFKNECLTKFQHKGLALWQLFGNLFNCLPVAAVVGDKLFCVHGGLSPNLKTLDHIRKLPRPMETPGAGLLCDLVWSDPDKGITGWRFNDARAISYRFGPDVIRQFLDRTKLSLIIRAHELVKKGFEVMPNKQLMTIFSAPNYTGTFNNNAAIVSVSENMDIAIIVLNYKLKKEKHLRKCEPQKNVFKKL